MKEKDGSKLKKGDFIILKDGFLIEVDKQIQVTENPATRGIQGHDITSGKKYDWIQYSYIRMKIDDKILDIIYNPSRRKILQ